MPDATFTSTCCDIFLFPHSVGILHSPSPEQTDRNFKFNSPFSEPGTTPNLPKKPPTQEGAHPTNEPSLPSARSTPSCGFSLPHLLPVSFGFFITYTENVKFLKTFYFAISLRVVKHFQALAQQQPEQQQQQWPKLTKLI